MPLFHIELTISLKGSSYRLIIPFLYNILYSAITIIDKYLENIATVNLKTAREYKNRLRSFSQFISEKYRFSIDELIKTMIAESHGVRVDVYDLLSEYITYLHRKGNLSSITLKGYVNSARNFLEYTDVEISPRKLKLKVKMPRVIRQSKEALTKEDIINILHACPNLKIKTYVLFLSATGCRATEAASIRLCDINFEASKIFIRGEFTKTKTDRHVFLTSEISNQLKVWLNYKYRLRKVSHYNEMKSLSNENNLMNKTFTEIRTPVQNSEDLIFSSSYHNASIDGLYITLVTAFEKTLDRMGGIYATYENSKKRRRKITLHSFRCYVKSTISDLGYGDYSEWFIGHIGSTYYRKNDKEKAELFEKIEPSLTFLDFPSIERKGADFQSKIEILNRENMLLRQVHSENTDAISNLSDQVMKLMTEVQELRTQG